jgi:hypothetical protein
MTPSYEPGAAFLGRFDEALGGDAIAEDSTSSCRCQSNSMGMRQSTWCSIVEAHEGRLRVIPNTPISGVLFYALKPQRPPAYFREYNADPFESRRFAGMLRSYVPRLDFFL